MKKYFYSMAIIAVFAIGFAASDDSSNVNKPVTNQDSISESVVKENQPTQSTDDSEDQFLDQVAGTYVVTDESNVTYNIYINRDKTMRAEAEGSTFYGSWRKVDGRVNFKFGCRDTNELPRIQFKVDLSLWIDNDYFLSEDGFLYGGGLFEPDKHNPDYRLKYNKIK